MGRGGRGVPGRGATNCDWAGIKSRQSRWSSRVVSSRKSLSLCRRVAVLWLRLNYYLINTLPSLPPTRVFYYLSIGLLYTQQVPIAPPKKRRMRLWLATLHTPPLVVADMIVGGPPAVALTRPLMDSGRRLFEETGLDNKDRFCRNVMDTGRTMGYCIIFHSNI